MIKLANTLYERETLDSEEIYELLGIKPKKNADDEEENGEKKEDYTIKNDEN